MELIYGKNPLGRIVSIEVEDEHATIFTESDEGLIETQKVPNKYWVLSPKSMREPCARLKGDLHYRYGKQFQTKKQWRAFLGNMGAADTYTIWDEKEALMVKDGYTYYKDMKFQDVSVLSFDIETTSLEYTHNDKVLLISNTFRKQGQIVHKLFAYDDFKSEGAMIEAWCTWVREMNPSILLGHNIISYDLPYLNAAAKNHGVTLNLGRNNTTAKFSSYPSRFRKDQSQFLEYKKVKIFGREIIDTYFLAIRYDVGSKKYGSYGLKNIIAQEGMEEKNRQFYDAGTIRFNYTRPEEWVKIKKYCETDSDDSVKLFDLMAPSFFYFCQSIPKSFQAIVEGASGAQLNALFVRSYLQQGHSIPKRSEVERFSGALSWGNPGIYANCLKADVSSLYPSIMLQYEVYPKNKDPQKNFLTILNFFTDQRLENKRLAEETNDKYYKDLSDSQKILINSSYGMMGAAGLNFNDPEAASLVTKYGREILDKAVLWATGKSYLEWNPTLEEETEDEEL